ncbi:unnamed protein product [Rhizoctonia solani]|uniref:Ubiquitin-like modifier HUB1 n=1 Tax=Rhizoctonia solani TaxID=456999 RepID=A0A8H2XQ02_9AGAM|nr:unnamed protein product [Rhizoctonia solani]
MVTYAEFAQTAQLAATIVMPLIEVIANDRLGRKVRVKCSPDDTVGDLKKLIAAQTGTDPSKIQLKKWQVITYRFRN